MVLSDIDIIQKKLAKNKRKLLKEKEIKILEEKLEQLNQNQDISIENEDEKKYCLNIIEKYINKFDLRLLHVRDVPVNSAVLGESIKLNEPSIVQFFLVPKNSISHQNEFESKLFLVRRHIELELRSFNFYSLSLSSRTIIYKGMIMSDLLILPYKSASQSGIISQAWKYNLPVIANDVGGLPEYIVDGKSGYVVKYNSISSLSKKIYNFFNSNDKIDMPKFIKLNKDKFSWDYYISGIWELIDES